MGFYDLSEEDRVRLTNNAIAERRTIYERWSALENTEADPWNERASIAAGFLQRCKSVADIGCGNMQLKKHLRPDVRYVPIDVVSRSPDTIVVDLNKESLPAIDVDGWAVLGVLEYLFDVPTLLRQLNGQAVITYNATDICDENRKSHAWVNAFNTAEIEAMFKAEGWRITDRYTMGGQRIWGLAR